MKLIIDIVDDDYNRINSYSDGKTFYPITARLYKAVKGGIPLKDEVMLATLMSLVTDKDYKPNLEGEQE